MVTDPSFDGWWILIGDLFIITILNQSSLMFMSLVFLRGRGEVIHCFSFFFVFFQFELYFHLSKINPDGLQATQSPL